MAHDAKSNDVRPIDAVLLELKSLVDGGASGFLFLVADDGQPLSIRLRNGHVEEITFANRHSDEAVDLLKKIRGARARFQPSVMAAIPSRYPPLSAAALDWLLGSREPPSPPAATRAPAAAPPTNAFGDQRARLRPLIEKIALNYFGPIAGLLCEEAFGESRDIEHILSQIARNLPERAESDRFFAEARAAVARIT